MGRIKRVIHRKQEYERSKTVFAEKIGVSRQAVRESVMRMSEELSKEG